MKFSVCIPNYNYEKYIAKTIRSVLSQSHHDLEVIVSDNASTDSSIAVINGIGDQRIRVHQNACNVGFSGNLDRAARLAEGDRIIMLSSDDLIRPGALEKYRILTESLGPSAENTIFSATWDIIDPVDAIVGKNGPDKNVWFESDRQPDLEAKLHAPVYKVRASELLRRSVERMRNPFNFAATSYSRALYQRSEGYGGGRLINPDKWFHWRLLGLADTAIFVDDPLFAYRWHPQNQSAQQAASGALKYLVDEYITTLEFDPKVLKELGIDRDKLVDAFVEHDIARHGLATLAHGSSTKARRILLFGHSVYPEASGRNWKIWALGGLLALGPIGQRIAGVAYSRYGKGDKAEGHEARH